MRVSGLVLLSLALGSPLFAQAEPRLLATPADLERTKSLAASQTWARSIADQIVATARAWPQPHLTKYGLKQLELPPEGGQWTLWDVCPVHGVSLRYTPPDTKICPIDNKRYSGWPFDQVTYDRRLDDLAVAARDLALAYRWTGERSYAEAAAWILNQFAERYLSYELHDKDNKLTRSGARAHSQTLDESVWLIPTAFAYDLLNGSDVFAPAERERIERDLLRAAVTVIQRNDAGMSNWQSWHNAAIGAVGFALGDQALIDQAINGRSGFRYQMRTSVTGEGFWYEGAWGYHFYALDPLIMLAEMAARNGYDLYAELPLWRMFNAPLGLVFPNGNLPAFNDSKEVSLYANDKLYEVAWARYGDPDLAAVLGTRTRGLYGLLWGASEFPRVMIANLRSAVFPESGYAVLRAPESDHTVAVKFGPHGGGHGHYDKPTFVSYFNGATMAIDPGTQSYAAPTHNTWDKVTVSHNTVVVDERTQGEATGALLWSDLENPVYRAVRVSAGPADMNAKLERTLLVTSEYAIDSFDAESLDGKDHKFDWVYHNDGRVVPDAAFTPYSSFPASYGYQHLSANRALSTSAPWQVTFDSNPTGPVTYGSVYNSNTNARGTFQTTSEQSLCGRYSAKASYEFSGASYILFSTPALTGLPNAVPVGVSLWIHGDGSNHRVAIRLYDASDERFVAPVIRVDWTGWKHIVVTDPESWNHYLGNNDGKFDLPVRQSAIELTYVEGGPKTGALFADDITVHFAEEPPVIAATFETPQRNLRLWMLGAAGTTAVTGNGLGPDLTRPVPYAMARRTGKRTNFTALLEPFQYAPAIASFEQSADGLFKIVTPEYTDTFRLTPQGVTNFERRR